MNEAQPPASLRYVHGHDLWGMPARARRSREVTVAPSSSLASAEKAPPSSRAHSLFVSVGTRLAPIFSGERRHPMLALFLVLALPAAAALLLYVMIHANAKVAEADDRPVQSSASGGFNPDS